MNYWVNSDSPKGLTDVDVKLENGTLVFEIDKDGSPAISDTDLFDVASAAGIDTSSGLELSWKDSSGNEAKDKTLSDFVTQWSAMLNNIKNGRNYTITVTTGDTTLTVELKGV